MEAVSSDFEGVSVTELLPESFLGEQAAVKERWQAVAQNLQAYYLRKSQASKISKFGKLGDLIWTSSRLCIASESSLNDGQMIDEIISWYRIQSPLQGAMWWYMHPEAPLKLDARLLARGLRPELDPHFMWCELHKPQDFPDPDSSIVVRLVTSDDYLASDEYNDPVYQALSEVVPRRVFHLVAFSGGARLGRCIVNVTTGQLGIAVLFDMMVVPTQRKRGIGAAQLQAACRLARNMGCKYMSLNATELGERLYRRFGFQSMGHGRTWALSFSVLAGTAATSLELKFLEAVGLGDVEELTKMREKLTLDQLRDPTLNDLTPFEIAARCQQPLSASWLLEQGVDPNIISMWDLGWKEQVALLIAKHPEMVKQEAGRWMATPLHIAVQRNDMELAKLLLTVPNDLDAKDASYYSTPKGWAYRFDRKEMLTLLKAHAGLDDPSSIHAVLEEILGKEQHAATRL